jgi:hypothetical protein
VGEVLATRRKVSAASVEHANHMYLVEKQLFTGHVADISPLGEDKDSTAPPNPPSRSLFALEEPTARVDHADANSVS